MAIQLELYSEGISQIFRRTSDESLAKILKANIKEIWQKKNESNEQYEARILTLIENYLKTNEPKH